MPVHGWARGRDRKRKKASPLGLGEWAVQKPRFYRYQFLVWVLVKYHNDMEYEGDAIPAKPIKSRP